LFTRTRRAHYLFASSLFGILGFHVGVWAVQLAPLAAGLRLDPAKLLALAGGSATLIPAVMLYGLAVSFVDLGANTVGSAYEQAYAVTAMTGLHAWFSGGALAGAIGSAVALSAGVTYRGVYLGLAAVMAAGLLVALAGPMPAASVGSGPGRQPVRPKVWRIPAVLFAIALISVTFFGDGALESFLSSYLQRTLAGGVLLSGFGIGSYYLASLLGRLTATATLRRFGERRVVLAAGLLAAAGLLIAVAAPDAPGAIGGLLAQATNLRVALGLLILTSLGIAGLATRWPGPPT